MKYPYFCGGTGLVRSRITIYELESVSVIPEREFEPHVAAGRIIERQHIDPPREDARVVKGQQIGMRRVLYALPGYHIEHFFRKRKGPDSVA